MVEAGDHAQDAALLGEFEIGLEADEVVETAREIVLPKLNHGIGTPTRAWVTQTDGTHGAEGERVYAALGDDFYGQATFKELTCFDACFYRVFKGAQFDALGGLKRIHKGVVFLFREGTVDVVAFVLIALAVTGGAEGNMHVDAFGVDNGCDGVEEEKMLFTAELCNGLRETFGGERPAGDDGWSVGDFLHLFADDFDVGMAGYSFSCHAREGFTVHGEGCACGESRGFGTFKQHGVECTQFVLEDTGGAVWQVGTQRVGTDQLGKVAAEVCAGGVDRAHFVEFDLESALGGLPGGFCAGESAADYC